MSVYRWATSSGELRALGHPGWMELDSPELAHLLGLLRTLLGRSPAEQMYVWGGLTGRVHQPGVGLTPRQRQWVEPWAEEFEAAWAGATLSEIHRVGLQFVLQCEGRLHTPAFQNIARILMALVSRQRLAEFAPLLDSPSRTPTRAELVETFALCLPLAPAVAVAPETAESTAAAALQAIEARHPQWTSGGTLKQRLCGVDLCAALRLCTGQSPPAPCPAGHSPHFCEHAETQAVWTEESILALARYFERRLQALGTRDRPIVEVGAGPGRLAALLNATQVLSVRVVATDIQAFGDVYPQEVLEQSRALEKYQPALVLSSWMPAGHDWTAQWRTMDFLREYVLLGEVRSVGQPWATFGVDGPPGARPPYAAEGFARRELPEVSAWLLSQVDLDGDPGCAAAFSFRRIKPASAGGTPRPPKRPRHAASSRPTLDGFATALADRCEFLL